MLQVGAFEAKNTFGSLLDRVQSGEEIVITRHGKPVARLIPNAGYVDHAQAQTAMDRIRARAAQLPAEPFDWEVYKRDRDTGRR